MSNLDKKITADKLAKIAKASERNGHAHLASCLLNIALIHLYGRDDVMRIMHASTQTGMKLAKEAPSLSKVDAPTGLPDDYVEEKFNEAAGAARLASEDKIASIIDFALAIRSMGRQDLMGELHKTAASLSNQSVNNKPDTGASVKEEDYDELTQQLRIAEETAAQNREFSIAAILSCISAIRVLDRYDLMERLGQAAYDLTGLATGRIEDEYEALLKSSDLNLANELKRLAGLAEHRESHLDRMTYSIIAAMVSIYLKGRDDLMREVAEQAAPRSLIAVGRQPNPGKHEESNDKTDNQDHQEEG